MPIPTAVFLDTCVLEKQSYNFSSAAISTFVPACSRRHVKLLLPDPTEREIKRHMAKRCADTVDRLNKVRREASFLEKWKGFPPYNTRLEEAVLHSDSAWSSFLCRFDVVRLSYENVAIEHVMNWYDRMQAPFGKGTKEKEFPDAFAIAILAAYAEKNGCSIAVVSHDADLRKACARYPSLMHFESLPALTELLLAGEDNRIAELRRMLDGATERIAQAAYSVPRYVTFRSGNPRSVIDDSTARSLRIAEVRIVALGEHECTITFDAVLSVSHLVEWSEPKGDGDWSNRHQRILKDHGVSGTAKVSFEATTDALVEISCMEINSDEIEVTDIPPF